MKDLFEALSIFARYKNAEWPTHCEHDVLMIMDVAREEVSDEDQKRLSELSFFWSDDNECWQSFRFGSA